MKSRDYGLLRLIAFFKLLKAIALITAGIAALKLVHADVGSVLEHWVTRLGLDPGSSLINHAIQRACELDTGGFKQLGIAGFLYAGLFLTEGIGLWLLKHWAEWFTVVITGSLIPFEIYEALHHPTALRILILIVNVAVVAYLIRRIKQERRTSNTHASHKAANPGTASSPLQSRTH